jgi:PilZ domain
MTGERDGSRPATRAPRRLPVDVPATVTVDGAPPQLGRVVNLTPHGAFIATPTPAPPETIVQLLLHLPLAAGARPAALSAQVRWTNEAAAPRSTTLPPGIGLQFVAMSPAAWDLLLAFIAERLATGDSEPDAGGRRDAAGTPGPDAEGAGVRPALSEVCP